MVFFDSSHTLCALTSQDGRQIHVGQIPQLFRAVRHHFLCLGFPQRIVTFETC